MQSMRSVPLAIKPQEPQADAQPVARELRSLVEFGVSVGVALLALVLVSFALRATELFITTKLVIPEAHAATLDEERAGYTATLLLRTRETITMAPGATMTYTLGFKNTGTTTWKNSGTRFLSIYTYDPKYRTSPFQDSSWRLREQPAIMKDGTVLPGTLGFFNFVLRAPTTPGTYTETFHLAAEDLLWIPGGKFSINITVSGSSVSPTSTVTPLATTTPTATTTTPVPVASSEYSAALLLRSHKTEIGLLPGATVNVTLGFKNIGTRVWTTQSLRRAGTQLAVTEPTFQHLSWLSPDEVVRVTRPTNPGELAFLSFTLQAPTTKGSYRPRFQLAANGSSVGGGEIEIPVSVTADGSSSTAPLPLPTISDIPEPIMRVGLFETTSPIMITANGDYDIYDGQGRLVETVRAGQPSKSTFDFNYRTVTVTTPSQTAALPEPVRFVSRSADGVFTIPSYSHPPGWNSSLNDNQFRGTLEIYYIETTGNLWVINELPVEKYLRGLAETSNISPLEFQKSLVTAARTYAFYHFSRNRKHGGHFHVDAEYDQVYRGYGNEVRTPNVTRAVEETRGHIVTYEGEVAVTPYFSRSDGRTRAWEEVWGGGPIAWLKSVPTPYDAGQTLWGHGVGMSARDALLRAREGGADWQTILKYYYTGVDLTKKWQ